MLLFVSGLYGRILEKRECEINQAVRRMAEPMPGKYKNKHQKLTYRIDQYVHYLVDEAELSRGTLTIEQKIALINALGKWVAIKNKLIDAMEGEKLDEFRARLRQGDALKSETGAPYVQRVDYEQKSEAGRRGMAKRWESQIPSHSMAPASSSASSESDFLARMTAVDPRQRRAGGSQDLARRDLI